MDKSETSFQTKQYPFPPKPSGHSCQAIPCCKPPRKKTRIHFQTATSCRRPVRLRKEIRQWAWESLHGVYGDDAMAHPYIAVDDIPDFHGLSPLEKYDAAIRQIALRAPLRICQEEQISGAATLGMAISHCVPVKYRGEVVCESVSHLTIRYDRVLKEGLSSYEQEIANRLTDKKLATSQRAFLHSLQKVIDSIGIWHGRYLEATRDVKPGIHRLLQQVPFSPARSFHEAVQSLWFLFAFLRLTGNWPGIGRIDWLLGEYLRCDLAQGILDREQAREILASLFIKGCEWIQSETPPGTGDAQHYQNIVLAGIDQDGQEIANEVTYLVLDIVEELGISDFPITLRLNARSPERLLNKAARVIRHGGGIVAVYNEDLILRSLCREGYAPQEAWMFANDGCWEVQIPGKTDFGYIPFDSLQLFNRAIGLDATDVPGTNCPNSGFQSIEDVYRAFLKELDLTIQNIYRENVLMPYTKKDGRWIRRNCPPASVVSLFEDGCIPHAASYFDFGPEYVVRSPHIGGAPDVANSLYALQKCVFEEHLVTFPEMITILRNNWADAEPLRQYVKNRYIYYGNDNDQADAWHSRILADFAKIVKQCRAGADCPVRFIPGVSTFGRQVNWLPMRAATAFGCRKGDILSGNDSPTPGTDRQGATSLIRSHCKADLVQQTCGAALDVKIFPQTLQGQNGITALKEMLRGFLRLGGYFMQLDTVDAETLLAAQREPEKYKTLSVRVSGWNARFVTLNREWQEMIIERTTQRPV